MGGVLLLGPARAGGPVRRGRGIATGGGTAVCGERQLRDQASTAPRSDRVCGAGAAGSTNGQRQAGARGRVPDRDGRGEPGYYDAGTGRAASGRPRRERHARDAVAVPLPTGLHI